MRPALSIPSPWTPWNAEPGTSLVTSYVCAAAPTTVEKSTVAATVAQCASLLVMTLPPVVFYRASIRPRRGFGKRILSAGGKPGCHKNDIGVTRGISLKLQALVSADFSGW
jgi:hypothetical protein